MCLGLPGALWHIFRPSDLPRLREYLTRLERFSRRSNTAATPTTPISDVIQDQRIYLSQEHFKELYKETGIKPFTILQFLGDAVFVPAGSVHQVRFLFGENKRRKPKTHVCKPGSFLPGCSYLREKCQNNFQGYIKKCVSSMLLWF